MGLHIREKENKSGSLSIQIVNRTHHKYKVIETIGCSNKKPNINLYLDIARARLKELNRELYPTLFDNINQEEDDLEFIDLAKKIDEIFDTVIITGKINASVLYENIKKAKKILLTDKAKLEETLAEETLPGDLVLFSNDAPTFI